MRAGHITGLMRDPDRIQPILDALGEAWRKSPDLRLTQLLTTVITDAPDRGPAPFFYVEDEEALTALRKWNAEQARADMEEAVTQRP